MAQINLDDYVLVKAKDGKMKYYKDGKFFSIEEIEAGKEAQPEGGMESVAKKVVVEPVKKEDTILVQSSVVETEVAPKQYIQIPTPKPAYVPQVSKEEMDLDKVNPIKELNNRRSEDQKVIDEKVGHIIDKLKIKFSDDKIETRFINVLTTYFRGIRKSKEIEYVLSLPKTSGGLELPTDKIKIIISLLAQVAKDTDKERNQVVKRPEPPKIEKPKEEKIEDDIQPVADFDHRLKPAPPIVYKKTEKNNLQEAIDQKRENNIPAAPPASTRQAQDDHLNKGVTTKGSALDDLLGKIGAAAKEDKKDVSQSPQIPKKQPTLDPQPIVKTQNDQKSQKGSAVDDMLSKMGIEKKSSASIVSNDVVVEEPPVIVQKPVVEQKAPTKTNSTSNSNIILEKQEEKSKSGSSKSALDDMLGKIGAGSAADTYQPSFSKKEEKPKEPVVSQTSSPLGGNPLLSKKKLNIPNEVEPKVDAIKVKKRSQLRGPIEELEYMELADFRLLGSDTDAIMKSIKNKIELLKDDAYIQMVKGIKAFKKSPIVKMYLHMNLQGLMEKKTIDQLIQDRQIKNEETLTISEFEAINTLNRELRFD